MTEATGPAEFTRLIDTARLPEGGAIEDLAATPAERAALARRFGLLALDRLEARVTLARLPGGFVRLSATLSAEVVQECVVTLAPVASRVEDSFSLLYGAAVAPEEDEVVVSGESELVEPLGDGVIDIGEAVAQQLSLALDPYPRAPGAAAEAPGDAIPASPFAALARWREKG
jgi:uncharacterized metal-binding protein YceD (DUF177 family)